MSQIFPLSIVLSASISIFACNGGKKANVVIGTTASDTAPIAGEDQASGQDSIELKRFTEEPACAPYVDPPAGFFSAEYPDGSKLYFCHELFTGFDGKNNYDIIWPVSYEPLVPADPAEPFSLNPSIVIEDPSIVSADLLPHPVGEDQYRRHYKITSKKAGKTKLTVTARGTSVSCIINVASYTPEMFELGKKRYLSPDQPGTDRKACTGCHASPEGSTENTKKTVPGVDISRNDAELQIKAVFGKVCKTDGTTNDRNFFGVHKWHLTKEEFEAIPAFLRSFVGPVKF